MIIKGTEIASDIKKKLKIDVQSLDFTPRVVLVSLGLDEVTSTYVHFKERLADEIGVDLNIFNYEESISTSELIEIISKLNLDNNVQGIVVQLPLPAHIDIDEVLSTISPEKDIDALNSETDLKNPVVGAIDEIFTREKINLENKKIVVLGAGRLVGRPTALWLTSFGLMVDLIDKKDKDPKDFLKKADVIISGAGAPHFIKREMIKDGAILIDAGASEASGKVVGDADPDCADKCLVFTPVPGGLGPITLVKLFENLITLIKKS